MMIRKSILKAAAAGLLTLAACQEQYDSIVPHDPVETPEVTYREFIDRAVRRICVGLQQHRTPYRK